MNIFILDTFKYYETPIVRCMKPDEYLNLIVHRSDDLTVIDVTAVIILDREKRVKFTDFAKSELALVKEMHQL